MLLKASRQIATVTRFAALIGLIVVLPIHAGESTVSAIGVVESVDCKSQTIKILGVTFAASDADNAAAICGAVGSVGLRFVSASGMAESGGSIVLSKLTTISSDSYVPGATRVYLKGSISETRVNSGEIVVGGATVSLVAADLKPGSKVEILGTQPLIGGLILPTNVRVVKGGSVSVLDSSIGSGFTTMSSIGSGASTNSSIGSGIAKSSSIGSGATANSSIGSGATTNSSIGSGIAKSSSIGSGATPNSSIGSGATTNSSIGSGIAKSSSIGSGATTDSSIGSGAL